MTPRCYGRTMSSVLALITASAFTMAHAQDVPIVQPGAPGEATQDLSVDQAVQVANATYSPDDVRYMQDMIPHHYQAILMSEMAPSRTNNPEILDLAGRIDITQKDEIAFMQEWLTIRGEDAPDPGSRRWRRRHNHSTHLTHAEMGMATQDQMEQLEASEGTAFDRLFLELMIPHHQGAVRMTRNLLRSGGNAFDPVMYDFVSELINDQGTEITRMATLLGTLSEDPRVGLSAGFRDAGEAAHNLTLLAALPKPEGFYAPNNPAGLPPQAESEDDDDAPRWIERFPRLSFWNTDMAFSGDHLIVGNYHGFNIYDLSEGGVPALQASVVCPGGQGDVSVVGDILIMSVEQTRGRLDCGTDGIEEQISEDRLRGLRIFDISDITRPQQVGVVQTCRGSHTHSVVSANEERIVVYNSGTSFVRDAEELDGCVGRIPEDNPTSYFSIDVIEIPLANPSQARITSSPRVFADDETGALAGLWTGGDHGEGTQETRTTDQCHDITVFPELNLAAGACSGNGIILDISDPYNPERIDDVTDPGFAYWHSATFNNDGDKVLFTDEWGGGTRPRCLASDSRSWGANAIYDIVDGELEFGGYYKLPGAQSDLENCVAHNGSVVPVPGRDIFAQAWYQGGLSVSDFTDSSDAFEIAFFDRGPLNEHRMHPGGYWSTYWYQGRLYATGMVRGLDVMELTPSEHLTENELAAAAMADMGDVFNPQQQFRVTWPDHPVVALAYVDQLQRTDVLNDNQESDIRTALTTAAALMETDANDEALADELARLADRLRVRSRDDQTAKRLVALRDTLNGVADTVR